MYFYAFMQIYVYIHTEQKDKSFESIPVDNFGTVVGENPNSYGLLALWAVNSQSIV